MTGDGLADAREVPSVFLVAQTRVLRELLASWLASVHDLEVIGWVDDSGAVARDERAREADVLVVEAPMVQGVVAALDAPVPVLAVGATEDDSLRQALASGACGSVGASASLDDLATAIAATTRGLSICTPHAAAMLAARTAPASAAAGPAPERHENGNGNGDAGGLTRREREILALVDAGMTNKAIAARLELSTATVKSHVHNVLEKLGASRRGEAAALVRSARPPVRA